MKTDVRGGEGCQYSDSTPTLPTTLRPDQTRQSPSASGSGKLRCSIASRICVRDLETSNIVRSIVLYAIERREGPRNVGLHGLYHIKGKILLLSSQIVGSEQAHMGKETWFWEARGRDSGSGVVLRVISGRKYFGTLEPPTFISCQMNESPLLLQLYITEKLQQTFQHSPLLSKDRERWKTFCLFQFKGD